MPTVGSTSDVALYKGDCLDEVGELMIKFLNCVGNVIFSGNMKAYVRNTVTKQVQEFM